jgi:hypothetical protein
VLWCRVFAVRNRHRIEAKVPGELYDLFAGYCTANGFSPSEGVRVLISRGLALDGGGTIDEAAYMAAYYNANQRIVAALAKWLGPSGGFTEKLRAVLRSAAASNGVELS